MPFSLDFANNTILSGFFFYFFIIELYFIIPLATSFINIFYCIEKFVIPIGIQIKEAKAEIEKHPLIVDAKIRTCSVYFRVVQTFLSFLFIKSFDLFLQWNNFLFRLYFSIWILVLYFLQPFFKSNYIFSIKPRIFNISIDSFFLSIFFSCLFLHLLQIIERANVFSKRYDSLGFSNFLYLPQITQVNILIFYLNKDILVLFYHSSHNY